MDLSVNEVQAMGLQSQSEKESTILINRPRLSLEGLWQFWADPDASFSPDTLPAGVEYAIHVPAPWQSQHPDLRYYAGVGWYRREVEIPAEWLESGILALGLGAVDYKAEVWLNGVYAGEHEGGYLPFELNLSGIAHPGVNVLLVRVDDSPAFFPEVPHGKQGWYGPLSGIWQPVWLEHRSALHVHSLTIAADLATGNVRAGLTFSQVGIVPHQALVQILGPAGEVLQSAQVPVPFRGESVTVALNVADPKAWSPGSPHLYSLVVEVQAGRVVVDQMAKSFGFRTIESREGKLYLNGEVLYLRAALDQDYYPDTIATTPSTAYLEDQLRKAKELGLNCLRCHIKVADPRYYEVADRLGMLIWTELPNWSVLTQESGERGRQTIEGILQRDSHHPSIIIWTIINENWGTDLVNDPAHRSWLRQMYTWLKQMDPTRLVVDNSACEPNFHVETDIEDFHYYRAIPDHRLEWDTFVNDFANRPPWTFSPHGDSVRTFKEPLILSEFGNWGLPNVDLLADETGREPWWFNTYGFDWCRDQVHPQGVRSRFQALGLARVFGSWQAFIDATQRQQHLALKYQIESMRRRPEIVGYVITELTDVHWECNGLLDLKRNTKVFHWDLAEVVADTVVMADWERVAYWACEPVQLGLRVAHGAGPALAGAEVRWWLAGTQIGGCLDVPTVEPGSSTAIGRVAFLAPETQTPGVWQLVLELRSQDGERVAVNRLDLSIFPARPAPQAGERRPVLFTNEIAWAERLSALGYEVSARQADAEAVIALRMTPELRKYIESGGRVLMLAGDGPAANGLLPQLNVEPRRGTGRDGDWASSFSWVKRDGLYAKLPGGPLIDHAFDQVIPDYVVTGQRDWEFPSQVKAGLVVGWVHKPSALITERRHGLGKAVITTFRLTLENLTSDPTAITLLDALIGDTVKGKDQAAKAW